MMRLGRKGLSVLTCIVAVVLPCSGCGEEEPEGSAGHSGTGAEGIVCESKLHDGDYALAFTIKFGREVDAGTYIQLGWDEEHRTARGRRIWSSRPFAANESIGRRLPCGGSEVEVRVEGLAPGNYKLFARLSIRGDEQFGRGDLGGYYVGDGTAGVTDPKRASIIEITDHDVTGLEFALGELR